MLLVTSANLTGGNRTIYLIAGIVSFTIAAVVLHLRNFSRAPPIAVKTSHDLFVKPAQILEIEGLKLGQHFAKGNITSDPRANHEDYVESLKESLQTRFGHTLGGEAEYPFCSPHYDRYQHATLQPSRTYLTGNTEKRGPVVAFAINLYDSEAIIPAQATALVTAIGHLLKHNRVYVSIFENGSTDKTQALLSDFAAALQALGVDGLWVHTSHLSSDYYDLDRIVVLSEIRNLALVPLMPYATNGQGVGTLVFLNDVVTCASDVLELIHQQRLQQADMAMGVDWGTVKSKDEDPSKSLTRLYDMWVLRGINGELPYPFEHDAGYSPHSDSGNWVQDAFRTQDNATFDRWRQGLALPIYSGWGGMAAFDASLFTHGHLRFRSSSVSGWEGGSSSGALSEWGRLIGKDGYLSSDCPGASECEYICRDIWNMRQGKGRIVLAPQARTTYSVEDWRLMQRQAPAKRRDGSGEEISDLVAWDNVVAPENVVCIATRNERGNLVDTWDERNQRKKLPPMFDYDASRSDE